MAPALVPNTTWILWDRVWGGALPCRWPSGQRREAKTNRRLHTIWVRFVASGAEQTLGGKAEAMPHELVSRNLSGAALVPAASALMPTLVYGNGMTETAHLLLGLLFDADDPAAERSHRRGNQNRAVAV